MNIKDESFTFGSYLQSERLNKGLDLGRVSRETKISIETLQLIENEDHEKLPAEVFVRGFLRTYAGLVGVDQEDVLNRYENSRAVYEEACEAKLEPNKSKSMRQPWISVSVVLLLCILLFLLFITQRGESPVPDPGSREQAQNNTAVTTEEKRAPSLPQPAAAGNVDDIPEVVPKKFQLIIETTENTWIKLIIDDQGPREYSLKPGDRLAFEAAVGYNLLVGNATGVDLTFNGNPVIVSGKRGQVVNIELP